MSIEAGEFPASNEPDRISRLVVWFSGVVFVVFIVVSVIVADGLMHGFAHGEPLHTKAPPPAEPELGIVEQSLVRDSRRGLDLVDEQRRSLDRWGWVDKPHGVARIPIDRAMDLVVRQGGK